MATPDVDRVFVDTNVLVYCSPQQTPLHDAAVEKLDSLREAGTELWISRQILREFMVVVTRPGATTLTNPIEAAVADVDVYQSIFSIAEDGPSATSELLSLVEDFAVAGKQIHDANIVATMKAHGVENLLTHNTSDFKRFSSMMSVIPLVS